MCGGEVADRSMFSTTAPDLSLAFASACVRARAPQSPADAPARSLTHLPMAQCTGRCGHKKIKMLQKDCKHPPTTERGVKIIFYMKKNLPL